MTDWLTHFEPTPEEILRRYKVGRSPNSKLHLLATRPWQTGWSACSSTRPRPVDQSPDPSEICKTCMRVATRECRAMPDAELATVTAGDYVVNLKTNLIHRVVEIGGALMVDCQRTLVEDFRDRLRRVPEALLDEVSPSNLCATCSYRSAPKRETEPKPPEPVRLPVGTLVETEHGIGAYGSPHRHGGYEVRIGGRWKRVTSVEVCKCRP